MQELDEKLRVLKQAKRGGGGASDTASVPPSPTLTDDTSSEDTSESTSPAPTDQWEMTLAQQTRSASSQSMWEDVAMRQFDQRQQAKVENQRLRGMLEAQLKLARGLERLLKRTNTDLVIPNNRLKRPRVAADGTVDASAFDELMGVIEDMYAQMKSVFSDSRFDREDAPLRDIQVSDDPTFGTVVDVFDARNLPFDLRATADAVWSYFASTSVSLEHEPIEITDEVIKKYISFIVQAQRDQATFCGRLAGRRYFEEGRIVILWVAMIEPEMPGGSSDGMVVRQKGWTIVKRPNRLPPNCEPDASAARIQSKHVAIPFVYDDVPDHKRKVGTLTNFVLHSVYSHLQTSRKVVENILLQNAMNK